MKFVSVVSPDVGQSWRKVRPERRDEHQNRTRKSERAGVETEEHRSAFHCLEDQQQSFSWSTVFAHEAGSSLPSQG